MQRTVLAGDIGGTKTILRLVSAEVDGPGGAIPALTTLWEKTYASKSFSDLVPMVHEFYKEAAESSVPVPAVDHACFGIAGAVSANTSDLTNLSWSLSGERLQNALSIPLVPSSMTLLPSATDFRFAGRRIGFVAGRTLGTYGTDSCYRGRDWFG